MNSNIPNLIEQLSPFKVLESGGMRYFILPPELNYLVSVEGDPVDCFPEEFTFLAAFDDNGLAGRMAVCTLPHIEGTWVREDLRSGRVGVTLLKTMEAKISATGRTHVWAFIYDEQPEISSYIERQGYVKMPLTLWTKDMTKENIKIKVKREG